MGSIWNVGVGRWHLAAAEDISLGLSCWHLPGTYLTSKVGQLLGGMPDTKEQSQRHASSEGALSANHHI